MAKLVRRHTSNVEIIGSNPIGSIFITLFGDTQVAAAFASIVI